MHSCVLACGTNAPPQSIVENSFNHNSGLKTFVMTVFITCHKCEKVSIGGIFGPDLRFRE